MEHIVKEIYNTIDTKRVEFERANYSMILKFLLNVIAKQLQIAMRGRVIINC